MLHCNFEMEYLKIFLVLGIFVVLLGTFFLIKPNEVEPTSDEKIETAYKAAQLSSYGWRTEQDRFEGVLAFQTYANSINKNNN